MRELTLNEVESVSGAGTLHDPVTNPQSEGGKFINDVAGALNEFGSWIGISIYNATH